jgi:hypothetical protein
MCLKGTGSPRIKEAGIAIKRSFTLKVALAFNIAMLAFIVTSLLLILRYFLTKFTTFTFKAASLTLA